MQVTFYNFTKRQNSTAQPGTGTTVNVALKDDCTITEPQLELNVGALNISNPRNFTYCRIPDFDRYYFCTGWTYSRGLWTGSFTVDVLASYKGVIGDSVKYVTRASGASSYDSTIVDTYYSTTAEADVMAVTTSSPITATSFASGSYVVITAGSGSNVYMMTPAAYQLFCLTLFEDSAIATEFRRYLDAGGSVSGVIQNIFWVPVGVQGTATTSVRVAQFNVPVSSGAYLVTSPTVTSSVSFASVPKHPQSATRGNYLNAAPYSRYAVTLPPFGNIDIPSELVIQNGSINFSLAIDIPTGDAILTLSNLGTKFSTWHSNVAVPVFLSLQHVNSTKQTQAILGTIGSTIATVGSAATGNYAGAAMGLISLANSFIGASQASEPVSSSIGSYGSFAALQGNPCLTCTFKHVVNANWTDTGRPYCSSVKLNTIPGYIQCADGEISISCTDSERAQISAYLTSGFFYED